MLRHQRHAHPAGPPGRPISGQSPRGEHRLDNGLLLRSDIHTLFDRRYLGIYPQHRLLVSPRLRADFSNGDQFYAKQGQVFDLPERLADRPGREFLEWHLDEVFLKTAAS
jgi:putative restriction endonuclease